jgi:glycerol-3-phosphate acyltransferase PlsX
MLTIAVDAMGGDHAPKSEVEGAIRAAASFPVKVILVGVEDVVRQELAQHPQAARLPVTVHHASQFITMEDSAARAVRSKKDSSIRVASRLVRDGVAQGVVSAGNTGAVMATAKMVQGMVRGVDRPALASALPSAKGTPVVLLDVGANVDSSPEMLAQFAVMGEMYSRIIFHNPSPRVGLLSIGEEEHKGNELTRAAWPLLKALPINFIGNVEGRDIFSGIADVVVCDGFIATVTRKIGYVLSRTAYREFRKRVDYSEYGGVPLLGVKGVSIICHGRSNANAVKNAIRVAAEFAQGSINEKIEAELDGSASSKVAAQ